MIGIAHFILNVVFLKDATRVGSGEHNTERQVVDGTSKGLGAVGLQVKSVAWRQVDYLKVRRMSTVSGAV